MEIIDIGKKILKGFFKRNQQPVEPLISTLDGFLKDQEPFMVELGHFRTKPTSIVLRLEEIDGALNQKLPPEMILSS